MPHLLHKAFKGISRVSWQALQQQPKKSLKVLALPHLLHKLSKGSSGSPGRPYNNNQKSHSKSLLCHTYCISFQRDLQGLLADPTQQQAKKSLKVLALPNVLHKAFKGIVRVSWQTYNNNNKKSHSKSLLCHTYCIKLSKGSPGSPGRPYNNSIKKGHSKSLLCHTYCIKL